MYQTWRRAADMQVDGAQPICKWMNVIVFGNRSLRMRFIRGTTRLGIQKKNPLTIAYIWCGVVVVGHIVINSWPDPISIIVNLVFFYTFQYVRLFFALCTFFFQFSLFFLSFWLLACDVYQSGDSRWCSAIFAHLPYALAWPSISFSVFFQLTTHRCVHARARACSVTVTMWPCINWCDLSHN